MNWMPIADAPKDRVIIAIADGECDGDSWYVESLIWHRCGAWVNHEGRASNATHYIETPDLPFGLVDETTGLTKEQIARIDRRNGVDPNGDFTIPSPPSPEEEARIVFEQIALYGFSIRGTYGSTSPPATDSADPERPS